jgi:hypothetical protein
MQENSLKREFYSRVSEVFQAALPAKIRMNSDKGNNLVNIWTEEKKIFKKL